MCRKTHFCDAMNFLEHNIVTSMNFKVITEVCVKLFVSKQQSCVFADGLWGKVCGWSSAMSSNCLSWFLAPFIYKTTESLAKIAKNLYQILAYRTKGGETWCKNTIILHTILVIHSIMKVIYVPKLSEILQYLTIPKYFITLQNPNTVWAGGM